MSIYLFFRRKIYEKTISTTFNCLPFGNKPVYVTAYADDEYNLQDVNKTAQYLAGWDVELDAGTLDYNCDGRVNLKDLV